MLRIAALFTYTSFVSWFEISGRTSRFKRERAGIAVRPIIIKIPPLTDARMYPRL